MAYTVPNATLIRPWQSNGRRRYAVYSTALTVDAGGDADSTIVCPPGRIIGVAYGIKTAPETYAVATSGDLTIKAESVAGVQILDVADLTSAQDGFLPLGTVAVDEARAATAATDAFSGGFPIRGGINTVVANGTEAEVITVDYLVRHCTYSRVTLRPTGSAGSATDTRTLKLGGPGVLSAVAIDFGSGFPATGDVTIKADDGTTGLTLFTSANSATDLAPSLLGRAAQDEAGNVTAATDGTESGNAFKRSLVVAVAEADPYTDATDEAIVELWIDD